MTLDICGAYIHTVFLGTPGEASHVLPGAGKGVQPHTKGTQAWGAVVLQRDLSYSP